MPRISNANGFLSRDGMSGGLGPEGIGDYDGAVLNNPRGRIDSRGTSGGMFPGGDLGGFSPTGSIAGGIGGYMPSGLANVYGDWASGNDGMTDVMTGMMGMTPVSQGDYTQAMADASVFGMPTIDLNIGGIQDQLNTYAANNPMSQIAQNIAQAGLNPSGRAAPTPTPSFTQADVDAAIKGLNDGTVTAEQLSQQYGFTPDQINTALNEINAQNNYTPTFNTDFDRNLPGGGTAAGTNTPVNDALDPNVIIDNAAEKNQTIEDLIGVYKDPDGNPYSVEAVIGALILSGNPNASTVLRNSGYNPDGTPVVTDDSSGGDNTGGDNTGGVGTVVIGSPGGGAAGGAAGGAGGTGADPGTGTGADPGTGTGTDTEDNTCPIVDGVQYEKNELGECAPPVNVDDKKDPLGGILPALGDLATGAATVAGIGGAMSGFSNAFSNTTKESQKMDPDIKNRLLDLFGNTPGIQNDLVNRLNTSYPGYGGDRFSNQNQDQLDFNETVRNNLANIPGLNIFEKGVDRADATATPTGASVANQAFGPTGLPLQEAARSNIQDVVAGQFAGTNLDPYQNPYQNQVIDAALGDLNRATDMRLQTADDQATKAGAYGGDRASIERGLIGEESLRTAGRMVADLRARGFEDAANRVEADLDRQMRAQQDNQTADTQTVRDALTTATAVSRDDPVNQLNASQALIDAFSTGSDQYRNYLADFMGVGDRLDSRDQRQKDFDFEQFAAAFGYDQNMIENMISLLNTAQGDVQKETSTEMGSMGKIAQAAELFPALGAAAGEFRNDDGDFKWPWEK